MTKVSEAKQASNRNMRSASRYLLRGFCALAGWFLVYVAVGNVIGFITAHRGQPWPTCWPYVTIGGIIEIDCINSIVTAFWSFFAVVPTAVILFPAAAIAFVYAAVKNFGPEGDGVDYFYEALLSTFFSIPILLTFWAGHRYWQRRFSRIGTLPILVIVAQIAIRAYQM